MAGGPGPAPPFLFGVVAMLAPTRTGRTLQQSARAAVQCCVVLRGTTAEMCDELRRQREPWGVSYVMVGESVMEQFAPVVEELTGR
jgi:hypothetical protein